MPSPIVLGSGPFSSARGAGGTVKVSLSAGPIKVAGEVGGKNMGQGKSTSRQPFSKPIRT